ncbi:uncharacterized protein BDZ99DRAFT_171466 [Mytilinidion resinicola]|uniref:Uncharacterized protein n=1 Tax=Mytilinidion resinicola TaxID=574789 RepID=A0A6A6Y4B4_9PEZI|nr:uncharacterized protein BDZ99DRAFT_171466 [Mytilinidion resinicola]KAF2803363.1 hypothetical protein BDZ99DRAFT_171466 [Mytilinidion resinicola]
MLQSLQKLWMMGVFPAHHVRGASRVLQTRLDHSPPSSCSPPRVRPRRRPSLVVLSSTGCTALSFTRLPPLDGASFRRALVVFHT